MCVRCVRPLSGGRCQSNSLHLDATRHPKRLRRWGIVWGCSVTLCLLSADVLWWRPRNSDQHYQTKVKFTKLLTRIISRNNGFWALLTEITGRIGEQKQNKTKLETVTLSSSPFASALCHELSENTITGKNKSPLLLLHGWSKSGIEISWLLSCMMWLNFVSLSSSLHYWIEFSYIWFASQLGLCEGQSRIGFNPPANLSNLTLFVNFSIKIYHPWDKCHHGRSQFLPRNIG